MVVGEAPGEQEDLRGLELHSEWVQVRPDAVQAVADCRARGGRVVFVTNAPSWLKSSR